MSTSSPSTNTNSLALMSMMMLAAMAAKQRAAATPAYQALQNNAFTNSLSSSANSSKTSASSQSKSTNNALATLADMVKVLNQAATSTNDKNDPQISMKDLDLFKMKLEKELSSSARREGQGNGNGSFSDEELRKFLKITDLLLENFNAIARLDGDNRTIGRQDLINAAALSGDPLTLDEHDISILKNGKDECLPTEQMPWWVVTKAAEQNKAACGASPASSAHSMTAQSASAAPASFNAFRLPTEGNEPKNQEVQPYQQGGDGSQQQEQQEQKRRQESKEEQADTDSAQESIAA